MKKQKRKYTIKPNENYKTQDEYVKYLCHKQGTTVEKMCEDLGYAYKPYLRTYKHHRMRNNRLIEVLDYTGGDANIMIRLPLHIEYYGEYKG